MTISNELVCVKIEDNDGHVWLLPKNHCVIWEDIFSRVHIMTFSHVELEFMYTDVTNISSTSAADLIVKLKPYFYV